MKEHSVSSKVMLTMAALIWGLAFVAQSVGMEYVGPFTYMCARGLVGTVFLIPCIKILDKMKDEGEQKVHSDRKTMIKGGICCGCALFVASAFQQVGIFYTTVGKAGFITTLYIIIVPILGLFFHKKVGVRIWISAVVALIGLYLLCMSETLQISKGDFLVLMCAFCFAIHILLVDHFSPLVDGVRLSCIQFGVCTILSALLMFIFEEPKMADILAAYKSILYAGVLSTGVGYTFQVIAQKQTHPTVASLLMSLESVFAVIGGWLILGERFTMKEGIGCILVFAAIICAQLPGKRK